MPGEAPLPFGAGWHPVVRPPAGHAARASAPPRASPATTRCLPVAAAPCDGLDGRRGRLLGLDTHFAGWDGVARIGWPGLALTITATGALATNLQVYAPPDQAVLCVEPSSHLPDAPNRPDLAAARADAGARDRAKS